jgi:hypothetical protein
MSRLIISLLLLLSAQVANAFSYTLEISEEELQEKVAEIMPIERKKYFVTVIFSHPKIELAENANQIGVYSQIDIKAPGDIKSTGQAKIIGSLSYEPTKSEFYFKNPAIVEIKLDKVPDTYMPTIKDIAQVMVSKMLATTPIYKLKGGDFKRDLAKSMLKSVTVANKQLLVELELF